jgi:hypothetical protein
MCCIDTTRCMEIMVLMPLDYITIYVMDFIFQLSRFVINTDQRSHRTYDTVIVLFIAIIFLNHKLLCNREI